MEGDPAGVPSRKKPARTAHGKFRIIFSRIASFGYAPITRSTILPCEKKTIFGIADILSCSANCWFSSVLHFPNVTFPENSCASSSMTGPDPPARPAPFGPEINHKGRMFLEQVVDVQLIDLDHATCNALVLQLLF